MLWSNSDKCNRIDRGATLSSMTLSARMLTRNVRIVAIVAMASWLASVPICAQEAPSVQEQLVEQKAKNDVLRARIAKLEEVLKSEVCTNPEAEKLIDETTPPVTTAPQQ